MEPELFLYHRVPKDCVGDMLYPLNQLRSVLPEVYGKEVAKYAGREAVLEQTIPGLDCLWNDALHLFCIPPAVIKDAWTKAGRAPELPLDVFAFPLSCFDPENTVIYLYAHRERVEEDFVPYSPEALHSLQDVPDAAFRYWQRSYAEGQSPLLFARIPHILYRGTLSIDRAVRITL